MALREPTPIWYWIIPILGLLWYLMGAWGISMQWLMSHEELVEFNKQHRSVMLNMPFWYTIAFSISVYVGTLANLMLLAKKRVAEPMFIISFIAVMVQMAYTAFVDQNLEIYGPGGIIMPIMIVIVALFFIWFSFYSKQKKWLD